MDTQEFADKLIKAMNEAMVNGHVDTLEELEDPNVVYHVASFGDLVGHEAHKQDILVLRPANSLKAGMLPTFI